MLTDLIPAAKTLNQFYAIIYLGHKIDEGPIMTEPLYNLSRYIPLLEKMEPPYIGIGNDDAAANSIIVKFDDEKQAQFVTLMITYPTNIDLRYDIIYRVYHEITGEDADYETKGNLEKELNLQTDLTNYFTIQSQLIQQYKGAGGEDLRKIAVDKAYDYVMGRPATTEEIDYWVKKNVFYTVIEAANLSWLYSRAGAKELTDTVDRFFSYNSIKEPAFGKWSTTSGKSNFIAFLKKYYNYPIAKMYYAYQYFKHPPPSP